MPRYFDLSHNIEDGMITYKGLPAPLICDWMSFDDSHDHYDAGTEFSMQTIELISNTGTYIDTPYHRYRDGTDLCGLDLSRISSVAGIVIRILPSDKRAIGRSAVEGFDVGGRAVLFHTGWDRHWRTDQYFEDHPFLTEETALYLRDQDAAVVGIDSYNIDDTADKKRPVHSRLLGAGIPIVEHMTNLDEIPDSGFLFSAVPPKVRGMGTFPVRAHALVE